MSELDIWNELGNIFYQTGAYDQAIRSYQKAIEINPGCGKSYCNLAGILIDVGRIAEAIPLFQKSIELTDGILEKASIWNLMGNAYRKLEDYANAAASYRKAIELDPEQPGFQDNLAEVEPATRITDSFASPLADLGSATVGNPTSSTPATTGMPDNESNPITGQLDPSNTAEQIPIIASPISTRLGSAEPGYLLRLGLLDWRNGMYERAVEFLKAAITNSENSNDHFLAALSNNAIAHVKADLGQIEDAILAFQRAADLAPERIFPWNNVGRLNCMLGRYLDGMAAFQKAIEHSSKDPAGWNGLGDVYHKLGRYEDAIAVYQLGNAFEKCQVEKDVLKDFETNFDAGKSDPQVLSKIGNIYYEMGAFKEAIESYQDAISLNPTDLSLQERLTIAQQAILTQTDPSDSGSVPENNCTEVRLVDIHEPETFTGSNGDHRTLGGTGIHAEPLGEKTSPEGQIFTLIAEDHFKDLVQLSPRLEKAPAADGIIHSTTAIKLQDEPSSEAISGLFGYELRKKEVGITPSLPNENGSDSLTPVPASVDLQTVENDIYAYRKVTEINPRNDRAWDALGNMYEVVGLHNEAIAAFEQAIALAPQKESYHYHLGIALAYQKDYDHAIQALQKVVDLNPDYVLAHCALAGYYRRLGMEDKAQEHIQIARPSMENENEYNQACFESISGNADRAIALLEVAYDKKQFQPAMIETDPDLDFIRTDPRFENLIQENRIINL